MHARTDNPELLKAQSLGLKSSHTLRIYTKQQRIKRIVVGGSRKTTITSMLLHSMAIVE